MVRSRPYFIDELTAVNLVESVGPMPCTIAMMAKAMPQAIRQYSIAVAPDSSDKNFASTTASGSPAEAFLHADTATRLRPDWLRGG